MTEKLQATQILSYLYLGSKADAKNKSRLKKLNIKYILNCTPTRSVDPDNGCPNFFEKDPDMGIVYRRIPIFDNRGENVLTHMAAACAFIESGKHYGNVLVHCHKGVSRSASFVIGYLMQYQELTVDEALAHLKACRPIVNPNSAFLEQLRTYQPPPLPDSSFTFSSSKKSKTDSTKQGSENPSSDDMCPSVGPSSGAGVPPIGPSVGPYSDVVPPVGPSIGPPVGPPVGPSVGPPVGPSVGPPVGPSVVFSEADSLSVGPSKITSDGSSNVVQDTLGPAAKRQKI